MIKNVDLFFLQIAKKKSYVTDDDVFILDLGETIYQYNGKECQAMEKFKVRI